MTDYKLKPLHASIQQFFSNTLPSKVVEYLNDQFNDQDDDKWYLHSIDINKLTLIYAYHHKLYNYASENKQSDHIDTKIFGLTDEFRNVFKSYIPTIDDNSSIQKLRGIIVNANTYHTIKLEYSYSEKRGHRFSYWGNNRVDNFFDKSKLNDIIKQANDKYIYNKNSQIQYKYVNYDIITGEILPPNDIKIKTFDCDEYKRNISRKLTEFVKDIKHVSPKSKPKLDLDQLISQIQELDIDDQQKILEILQPTQTQ